MSFSRRWLLMALAAAGSLSACGFHPLYGEHAGSVDVPDEFRSINIQPIADRTGQILRNDLVNQMQPRGRVANPLYVLSIKLTESKANLGQKKSAFATRANLRIDAHLQLYDRQVGKTVLETSVRAVSSYDILSNDYGTLIAEKNARENALRTLSREITLKLGSFFASQPS